MGGAVEEGATIGTQLLVVNHPITPEQKMCLDMRLSLDTGFVC